MYPSIASSLDSGDSHTFPYPSLMDMIRLKPLSETMVFWLYDDLSDAIGEENCRGCFFMHNVYYNESSDRFELHCSPVRGGSLLIDIQNIARIVLASTLSLQQYFDFQLSACSLANIPSDYTRSIVRELLFEKNEQIVYKNFRHYYQYNAIQ
ncbi:hypothetical protein RCL1_006182 [Eukaryota sp. TZLM3-RCL]